MTIFPQKPSTESLAAISTTSSPSGILTPVSVLVNGCSVTCGWASSWLCSTKPLGVLTTHRSAYFSQPVSGEETVAVTRYEDPILTTSAKMTLAQPSVDSDGSDDDEQDAATTINTSAASELRPARETSPSRSGLNAMGIHLAARATLEGSSPQRPDPRTTTQWWNRGSRQSNKNSSIHDHGPPDMTPRSLSSTTSRSSITGFGSTPVST